MQLINNKTANQNYVSQTTALPIYFLGRGKDISNEGNLPRVTSVRISAVQTDHPPPPNEETQVSVELGLIVPGKTSLIIPQLRGIIRAIRTAWFTKPVQHFHDKQTGTRWKTKQEETSEKVAECIHEVKPASS